HAPADPAPALGHRVTRSCLTTSGASTEEAFAGRLPDGEQPDRQWIAARLYPLSYLLSRPQPRAGGFYFWADEAFYERCDERRIQDAVDLVLAHLGLAKSTVGHAAFDPNLESGARVTHAKSSAYIQFSPAHAGDPHAVGALVAHACAHVLVRHRGLPAM